MSTAQLKKDNDELEKKLIDYDAQFIILNAKIAALESVIKKQTGEISIKNKEVKNISMLYHDLNRVHKCKIDRLSNALIALNSLYQNSNLPRFFHDQIKKCYEEDAKINLEMNKARK